MAETSQLQTSKRLAIIFRMLIMGYNQAEIQKEVGGDFTTIAGEVNAIQAMQREYLDLEKVRTGIALDLDSVGMQLADVIQSEEVQTKTMIKLEYYKQLLAVLRQKAELYGLNGPTININNTGRMVDLINELRAIGEASAPPELPAAPSGVEDYEILSIPATDTTAPG